MERRLRLTDGVIDLRREAFCRDDGEEVPLTAREAALLRHLAERGENTVVSREELQTEVWGYAPGVLSRAVDNAIRRLRQKIEADPTEPRHLLTVFSEGYRLQLALAAAEEESEGEAQPPGLFGRAGELAALRAAEAAGARLVTLCGPGGIGKTRLAREWLGLRAVGVDVFVDLAAVGEGADIGAALARALGVSGGAAGALAALIHGPPRRVVLDNCEHLGEGAAGWAQRLVEEAPAVRVLATSREPLGLPGEVIVRLSPLSAEASAALLTARAAALSVSLPERRWVEGLVARLDGLPLAMELAAARLGVLGPAELLERLAASLDLLGRHGDAGRHGTMRAAVGWSWALQPPWARRALVRCAVFRGGFRLAAAEAVLAPLPGGAPPVIDVLEHLRRSSLLQSEPAPGGRRRLRLLEVIRQFVVEQAEPGELDDARARHARCFAAVAATEAAREHDNLLAAFGWAAGRDGALAVDLAEALAPGFRAHGPPERWLAVTDALAGLTLSERDAARAGLLRFEARTALGRPTDPAALDAAERAEGDAALRDRARLLRGRWHLSRGEPAAALALLRAALADDPAPRMRGYLLFDLAGLQAAMQRLEAATARYREALAAFERVGDEPRVTRTEMHLAMVLIEAGALDEARRRGMRAVERLQRAGDLGGEGVMRANLALVALESSDLPEAEAQLRAAERCNRAVGARRFLGYGHLLRAQLAQARDQSAHMEAAAVRAVEIFAAVDDRRFWALARARLAVARALRGELTAAEEDLRAAEAALEALPNPHLQQGLSVLRGFLDLRRGDPGAARARLRAVDPAAPSSFLRMAARDLDAALSAV